MAARDDNNSDKCKVVSVSSIEGVVGEGVTPFILNRLLD